ncbi:hypothetical protein N9B90_01685 [bacterium]|nr:hypothetical protein [bacterium]
MFRKSIARRLLMSKVFSSSLILTLRDVIDFYVRGGNPNANLDHKLKKLDLTKEDQDALIAFLRSL